MSRLCPLAVFVLLVVVHAASARNAEARAAPRLAASTDVEDLLGDGDIDTEDLVGRATVGRSAMRAPPGGQAWLSLAGFTKTTVAGERETGGFIVVGLPFDRVARASATSAVRWSSAGVAAASGLAEPESVTPRLARTAVEAAWRVAGLGSDDSRLDAIVSRARWSAVLPETRLRAIRFDDQRLTTDATTSDPRLRDSAGANVGLEARLTWRFDRLLYSEDEPSFERMRLERHDARSRIAARVLEALFHWHRAWLELRWAQAASREAREAPGRPSRDEAESALRVMEAEATLDVLTAGWFTSSRGRGSAARPIGPPAPGAGPAPGSGQGQGSGTSDAL